MMTHTSDVVQGLQEPFLRDKLSTGGPLTFRPQETHAGGQVALFLMRHVFPGVDPGKIVES